ncbi:MAG: sulfite exporter TauE/SafE family protein [Cryobacterium sp.]|nr:sulfite exporter TauE/SafE family protein [Oligoflexia bacterium]
MQTLFPLLIIVFLSNIVEACAGFGATLLAIIFGAQFFSIEELVPILVPLNLVLNTVIVIRHPAEINRPQLLNRILPLAALGMPIGIFLFESAPSRLLKVGFGCIVVVLGLVEICRSTVLKKNDVASTQPSAEKPLSAGASAFFLIAGGIMQGLYASGGPFVVYYASRMIPNKGQFRTTLALLWGVLNMILIFTLTIGGKLNFSTLRTSFYLLPCVLLGTFIGIKVHNLVSEKHFRRIVYALLVVAGSSLAIRSF